MRPKHLLGLAIVGGLVVLFSAYPRVGLDLEEAVLDGDYAIIVYLHVTNSGGPGFVGLDVELHYAGQTYTRHLGFFLFRERDFTLIFREPSYLEGVLATLGAVTQGLETVLEAGSVTVRVRRTWPRT